MPIKEISNVNNGKINPDKRAGHTPHSQRQGKNSGDRADKLGLRVINEAFDQVALTREPDRHKPGYMKLFEGIYCYGRNLVNANTLHKKYKSTKRELEEAKARAAKAEAKAAEAESRASAAENELNKLKLYVGIDDLTRMYNKKSLDHSLVHYYGLAQREKSAISFIMIDIDKFKDINDTYGHIPGDIVLREIAGILSHSKRISDIVGRWGGEEFALILPNTDSQGALNVAEKIRKNIESTSFNINGHLVSCTVSIGVNTYDFSEKIEDLISKETLKTQADQALYVAKHNGRNRIVAFNDDVHDKFSEYQQEMLKNLNN